MREAEQNTSGYCQRCHRGGQHVIKSIGLDNLPHDVCGSCLDREEKHTNLKKNWRRGRRVRVSVVWSVTWRARFEMRKFSMF